MNQTQSRQQAKCENCGNLFYLGFDGVDRDGHDLCDKCAGVIRWNHGGAIAFDPADQVFDEDELTDMEKA